MRKIIYLLNLIFLVSLFINAQQSNIITKKAFENNLSGECTILCSKLGIDGEKSIKTFEVDIASEGEYYLSAWLMIPV